MDGAIPFEDALRTRLELMRPSAAQVEGLRAPPWFYFSPFPRKRADPRLGVGCQLAQCALARPAVLTDGIAALVAALHARGTRVYLVTGAGAGRSSPRLMHAWEGGFRSLVVDVARRLNVPPENVFANDLLVSAR